MMYQTPQHISHEVVHDDSMPNTEAREIDRDKYGECYDPKSFRRVKTVPGFEADKDNDSDAY